MNTPNSRVIALLKVIDNQVHSFGEGTYIGDLEPPEDIRWYDGQKNPCIKLDNGKTVWGCECWWGPAETIKNKYPEPEWEWIEVDINEKRASWRKEGEL